MTMFARRVRVEVVRPTGAVPCPLDWLDSFSMRSFTGRSAFDDTFPAGDGELEFGLRVDLEALRLDMEDWLKRKFGAGAPMRLRFTSFSG